MRCETCQYSSFPGMIPAVPIVHNGIPLMSWVSCPDCIGGIASCCDTAGANQAHILDFVEKGCSDEH